MQGAYALRRWWLARIGWSTRGVKVMVQDTAGALLLVRHSYSDSAAWMLPGGAIGRREAPEAAVLREIHEETRCRLAQIRPAGVFAARAEGRRDMVYLFCAITVDAPVADPREIAEARFFALDALPDGVSPATQRRIDEMRGARVSDGRW